MQSLARQENKPFAALIIPGAHHWSVLQPTCILIAEEILKDTGPVCSIRMDLNKLIKIHQELPQPNQVAWLE
jgi:hypothetical protein